MKKRDETGQFVDYAGPGRPQGSKDEASKMKVTHVIELGDWMYDAIMFGVVGSALLLYMVLSGWAWSVEKIWEPVVEAKEETQRKLGVFWSGMTYPFRAAWGAVKGDIVWK